MLDLNPGQCSLQMLSEMMDSLPIPMYAYKPVEDDCTPLLMNRKCLEMIDADSLMDAISYSGGRLSKFVDPQDLEAVTANIKRLMASPGMTISYEYRIVTKRNRHRLIRIQSTGLRDDEGNPAIVDLAVGLDAQPDVVEDLLDPVTGLVSMHSFFKIMKKVRAEYRVGVDGEELALLYLDVINFRSINAVSGISSGDAFLKSLGDKLRALFPASPISRFDVDHFAILAHSNNLEAKATSIRQLVHGIAPRGVDVSIGACIWDNYGLSPEVVCDRAKAACDDSRKHVNTFFSIFNDEMGKHLENSEYVVSHIDQAVQDRWLRVYYKPIIRSASGNLCGMEALARWVDPQRGMLSPGVFIGPLEESQQIWKLDLFVVKEVINLIAQREKVGMTEIPISVNLSRIDFLCSDVFALIDSLVKESGIPRRLLCIEITESAVALQDKAITRALARFRDAGYEVWMDDFGSGVSSLNLLKDYDFDVLKLDMEFLHDETIRSREIVSSVVSMDKGIGLRTLAEGVETDEQADYLRKMGCEKMQGFYFGKPLPFDDSLRECLNRGITIESAKQKSFFDAAAAVNFCSDAALILFDYCHGVFHILQMNELASRMILDYGTNGRLQFEEAVNEWNRTSNHALDRAMKYSIETGKAGEQAVSFLGKDMVFRFRVVKQLDGHNLVVAHYFDISSRMAEITNLAKSTNRILEFYRNVFYLNIENQTIQSLRFGNNISGSEELGAVALRDENGEYSSLLPGIFQLDKDRYQSFIDPTTLAARLDAADGGVLRDIFRTTRTDGSFQWMEHMLVFMDGSSKKAALYGIRPLNIKDLTEELSVAQGSASAELLRNGAGDERALWDSFLSYVPIKLFWKDADRKFLGATRAFLDYYGFDSVESIVGKTDEDMRWHPLAERYKDVEQSVLKSGQVYCDVPGECIRSGSNRKILATKWPVYKDGKICGLMGYFREDSADDVLAQKADSVDQPTNGMRKVDQFIEDFLSYVADYDLANRAFAVIYIALPDAARICSEFGRQVLDDLLSTCDNAILDVMGNGGVAVQLGVGKYWILRKYQSRDEVERIAESMRRRMEAIHRVDGFALTISTDVKIGYEHELLEVEKRLARLVFGTGVREGQLLEGSAQGGDQTFRDLMNSVPIACYVLKPDFTILFWNHEAERLLGFSAQEMVGFKCVDMPLGCSYATNNDVLKECCPAIYVLATGRPKTMQMVMRHKNGEKVLISNTLVPIADDGGHIYELVSFFTPILGNEKDKRLLREVYQLATRDPVTNLPGRTFMEECINEALELYRRTNHKFAVLFADVDNFHDINNSYGHQAGDMVLRSFGDALLKHGRKTDDFCRWGGDEFVGLLQLKDKEELRGAARRFMGIAESSSIQDGDNTIVCRVSIGMTVVRDGDDLSSLVNRADRYMFEAKGHRGEGIVTDFDAQAKCGDK